MTTPRDLSSRNADLIGSWKLLTFMAEVQATGAKQPIFGPTPKGRLVILESGQMMTVVTAGGQTAPATDAERVKSPGIVAYSGSYEISGDQFTTHVDVSSNDAWVGTSQSRTFKFAGSRLHLSTAWGPSPFDPSTVLRGVSEWERET